MADDDHTLSPADSADVAPEPVSAAPRSRRKRARSEIQRLRAHAEELEIRLLLLKRFCEPTARYCSILDSAAAATAVVAGREPSARRENASASVSLQVVAEELSALHKSKRRNLALKRELEEQKKISAALKELFRHQLSQEDLEFLAEVKRQNGGSDADDATDSCVDVVEVERSEPLLRIEALYARTDEILAKFATQNVRRTFATSNSEVDPPLGSFYEHLANTPLPCDFEMLEQFLWRQAAIISQFDCGRPSHRHTGPDTADSYEKRFSVVLNGTHGKRSMDGAFTIRRFVEPHRVVFVLTSAHTFTESSLAVHQDGYVVVTDASRLPGPSGDRSSARASVQTYFRIHSENRRNELEIPEDVSELHDFVMEHISQNITKYHHRVQKVLLRAAKSGAFTEKHHRELCFGCVVCDLYACSLELTV